MKNIFIIIFLSLSVQCVFGQNKRDYVWLLGADGKAEPGAQTFTFDFNQKPFEPVATDNYYDMEANASICDKEGNLLFYSNGCAVLDAGRQVMPNGDSINYGQFFEWFNGSNCFHGYPAGQDIIILTDPANENGYYLIHKKKRKPPTGSIYTKQILYTYIDMTLNNGKGDVVEKNIVLNDEILMSNYLTAIQHANGKDWWIIQPTRNSEKFLTFLLDATGIHRQADQEMGYEVNGDWASAGGTSKFSPDGTKYAMYNFYHQLHIYDFDRETGLFSNHQLVEVYPKGQQKLYFSSVEWSPNSRFIYTASRLELHQIDTWEENMEDGIVLIGEYDGTHNPFANTFFLMAQGPDCRIYICSTSGNETYHVINHPDEKGLACDFVQNGIVLPHAAGFASMPNLPRLRVDEEEKCDPSIVSMFGMPVYTRYKLEAYPNPARDIVKVKIPENQKGNLEIRDSKGRLVEIVDVSPHTIEHPLRLGRYGKGVYYLEFVPHENKERKIFSTKIILR